MTRPSAARAVGPGWTRQVCLAEGWNWARSSRLIGSAFVVIFIVGCAVSGSLDAVVSQRIADSEARWIAAGGLDLAVVHGDDEYEISSNRCESVTSLAGTTASVALARRPDPVILASAPGRELNVATTTAGLWRWLGRQAAPGRDAVLSSSVAADLGVVDQDVIIVRPAPGTSGTDLPEGPVRVTVADTAALGGNYQGLLLPAAGRFLAQTCFVRAAPGAYDSLRLSAGGLVDGSDQVRVREALPDGEFVRDFQREWTTRLSQWAWLPVALVAALYWLVACWSRRGQVALLVTLGLRRPGLVLLRCTEWLALAIPAAFWAITLGWSIAVAFDAEPSRALSYVLRSTSCALCAAAAVLLPMAFLGASRSHVLSSLKDR